MDIQQVAGEQKEILKNNNIRLDESMENLDKPWGGYIYINTDDTTTFIERYFIGADFSFNSSLDLQPKILMILPQQRLSWQYHNRRAEFWRAVDSRVGYHQSKTDDMGQLKTLDAGLYTFKHTGETPSSRTRSGWNSGRDLAAHRP